MSLFAIAAVLASSVASTMDAPLSTQRFALVIGHDAGTADEVPLRYARLDAERMADVLGRVAGVRAADMLVLVDDRDDASTVFAALDDLERRIAAARGPTLLVVYYSGHANQSALHLGTSALPLRDLDDKLRASTATTRLLILDACRSGTLTRVKGDGTFPNVGASGYAVVTASAAGEDAAESDTLQGSFFTHALTSGLAGAADVDGDGRLMLGEVYRYAFAHTVQLSATSTGGVQHPTFRIELRGRDDLLLGVIDPQRASIVAPPMLQLLVFSAGRVVGEVTATDTARTLMVAPGVYSVVARSDDARYEGNVVVDGPHTPVDVDRLQRLGGARLVRKGEGGREAIAGLVVGAQIMTSALSPTLGLQVQTPIALPFVTITPRLDVGRGIEWTSVHGSAEIEQELISVRATTVVAVVADWSWASASVGVLAGVHAAHQTARRAWATDSTIAIGVVGGIDVGVQIPVWQRFFVELGGEGAVSSIGIVDDDSLNVQLAPRLAIGAWL